MHGRNIAAAVLVVAASALGPEPALADGPYEPNNSESAAVALPATGVVGGALETVNDWDHFAFYARGDRQVTIQLVQSAEADCWVGGDMRSPNELGDHDVSTDGDQPARSLPVTLRAGERYVVRTWSNCAGSQYTFSVAPADAISPVPVPGKACVGARSRTAGARALVKRRGAKVRAARRARTRRAARRALERSKQRLRAAKAAEATACRPAA
jgi:hypothetical protein